MHDEFYFFLRRQYLQEKVICLYPATSRQKIGQYFFI